MRFQRPPFRDREDQPLRENLPQDELPDDEADGTLKREAEYLHHLAQERTPVAVHLVTGESFQGFIEYYDRRFIRLTRQGAPNLFIFKKDIKYLSEGDKSPGQ